MLENKEMDWNDGITNSEQDSEYHVPAIGEYDFRIVSFEKTISKAGNKMAKICIELDGPSHCRVYDYLVLNQSSAWKLAQFFESLGLKEKDKELTRMPWDKVEGATGRVRIRHEDYQGRTTCKVDHYVIKENVKVEDTRKEEDIGNEEQAEGAAEAGSLPFEI